nr:GtrA family protein [Bacteroidota bacterium]
MFTRRSDGFSKTFDQLTGFGLLGVFSFGLNIFITISLHEILHVPVRIAYACGLLTIILTNFYFSRRIIFQSSANIWRQLVIFIASSFMFRGLEYGAFLFQEATIDIEYILAILLIHGTSFFIKFFYYKLFVFEYRK